MKPTIYNTKQKTAIINAIKSMGDKHFTVDSLCEILQTNNQSVGRTTVYRCLEKLNHDAVLRKYTAPSGESSCYQYVGKNNHCNEHFHLKCEKCGSLIHMECDELNGIISHIKTHHGFNLNPLKTVMYGVCEDCRTK